MIKNKIIPYRLLPILFFTILSCSSEEEILLEVEDGQISFIFRDSTYLIDNPWVTKRTDISHTGPEVSVIEITGDMSDTESFTIWVRNYIDEPLDCILETDYYVDILTSQDRNQCVTYDHLMYCNAASITYTEKLATYGSGLGSVTISKCANMLISGSFESEPDFRSGIFQNLVIY